MAWKTGGKGYVNQYTIPAGGVEAIPLTETNSNWGHITPANLCIQNGSGSERIGVDIDGLKYECGAYSNVAFPVVDNISAVITNNNDHSIGVIVIDEEHSAHYLNRYTSFPAPPAAFDPLLEPLLCIDAINTLGSFRTKLYDDITSINSTSATIETTDNLPWMISSLELKPAISVTNNVSIPNKIGGDFAVDLWLYTSISAGTGSTTLSIISTPLITSPKIGRLEFSRNTDSVSILFLDGTSFIMQKLTWTHLAVSYNAATRTTLTYINGLLANVYVNTGTAYMSANPTIIIGRAGGTVATAILKVAAIRIWARNQFTQNFTPPQGYYTYK
jgi:hypothetical protein